MLETAGTVVVVVVDEAGVVVTESMDEEDDPTGTSAAEAIGGDGVLRFAPPKAMPVLSGAVGVSAKGVVEATAGVGVGEDPLVNKGVGSPPRVSRMLLGIVGMGVVVMVSAGGEVDVASRSSVGLGAVSCVTLVGGEEAAPKRRYISAQVSGVKGHCMICRQTGMVTNSGRNQGRLFMNCSINRSKKVSSCTGRVPFTASWRRR